MEHFTYIKVTKPSDNPHKRKYLLLIALFSFSALCMFIAGVVLLIKQAARVPQAGSDEALRWMSSKIIDLDQYCEESEEAKRIGLNGFLERCQLLYFKLHPSAEYFKEELASERELDRIARKFTPYVPTQRFLRAFTDHMLTLKREINQLKADTRKMKPKEAQILAEIKVFLDQFMGEIYDIDYYGGDWMLGPNYFCLNTICRLPNGIKMFLNYFQMRSKQDIERVIHIFHTYKTTFKTYTANMRLGVKSGMVKSKSSCRSGADALKEKSYWITHQRDGGASLLIPPSFTHYLPPHVHKAWEQQHNESVTKSLHRAWVLGFKKPLKTFIRYLERDHMRRCPPDDVAGGLSHLPLPYEYLDGQPQYSKRTTRTLPGTNMALSGKELYKKILPRFTTTNISVQTVHEEGMKQLKIFHKQLIEVSQRYFREQREDIAVSKMKKEMWSDRQWHGVLKFPKNESGAHAYRTCTNDEKAKKYCPVRWDSMQKWANYMYRVMGMIPSKLNKVFHFTGSKVSVPSCPIKMTPHYNPSSGVMFFRTSDAKCTRPCEFGLPFFLERFGPRFQEWSVNGHEGRPGHHFQYQGMMETFAYPCSKGLSSFFHSLSYLDGFAEGWALYGENPVLSHDVRLYEDNPLQEIGMIKWQIWRAIRLVVDTGLHYRHKSRVWALKMFEEYAWDETDFPRKEVVRYMSCPGQATAYMIGRLQILEAREKAQRELGNEFDLKDFHYQVLSLGQAPLGYLQEHIDRYISCMKNPSQMYCEYMLTPVKEVPKGKAETGGRRRTMNLHTHMHTHYI